MGKEACFGFLDAKTERKIYFIAQKFILITIICEKHWLFMLQFNLLLQELLRERVGRGIHGRGEEEKCNIQA